MKLTEAEYSQLEAALRDAFTAYTDIGPVVRRAGFRIQDITPDGPMPSVVQQVIDYLESRDRIPALVSAARNANPYNIGLFKLSASLGIEPGDPLRSTGSEEGALARTAGHLERMVNRERGIEDLGKFAARMQELMRQVCRIELGDESGTGFLIGPDTVLTNYHVVAGVIAGRLSPEHIVLRFDYHRLRDGLLVNPGTTYSLADKWIVASAKFSAVDLQRYDPSTPPADGELDYAILRLANNVGLEDLPGGPRGWITPREQPYDFPDDAFLMVVQHPCGDPIAFDYADHAVIRVNANATRVHYRINTLPGSSGSPVLNRHLDLVALHHSGEPGAPDQFLPCKQQLASGEYNEGIPLARILSDVGAKGVSWAFGGGTGARVETPSPGPAPRDTSLKPQMTNVDHHGLTETVGVNAETGTGYAAAQHPSQNPQAMEHDRAPGRGAEARASNVTIAPSEPSSPLKPRAAVNSPPASGGLGDDARRKASQAMQLSAVEALERLRELMDEALSRFGTTDASREVAGVAQGSELDNYVDEVNALAAQIAVVQYLPVERDALMALLHDLIACVLAGLRVAEESEAFDVVADLARKAADAYGTVGEALGGEQGQMFLRVAPYWHMKSAHARHREKALAQRRRLEAYSQPRLRENQMASPTADHLDTLRSGQ